MRGQGRLYRQPGAQVWWIDYSIRGERHRESTGTASRRDAIAMLRERIGKRQDGTLRGRPERVTLADLKAGLERHYMLADCASWRRARQAFVHLEAFFGATARAMEITRARVSDYQEARLLKGGARNTIRYETGVLGAAFNKAMENGILSAVPKFPQLPEGEKRSGFFEAADFAAVVVELPQEIAEFVRFLRLTGWRRGEARDLLWPNIEWDDDQYPGTHAEPVPGPNACIRITEAETKGSDAREFPLSGADELRELLLARWRARDGLRVFHRQGKAIGDFRKLWGPACTKAGVPGRVVHDLRRSAARDFRRAGVSEGEIMKLCGWKTRSMFDRYNVIDSADLARAVAKRFNGIVTAYSDASAGVPE